MKTLSDTATPKLFIGIDIDKRSGYILTANDLTTGNGFSRKARLEALRKYVEKSYSNFQVFNRFPLNLPLQKGGFYAIPIGRFGTVQLSVSRRGERRSDAGRTLSCWRRCFYFFNSSGLQIFW